MKQQASRTLSAVAALCLVLAPWSGNGWTKDAASIHPFSQVEVGKIHLQLAPNGRSAVLRVETNPPTVCAVAYGKTASLGSIADDPNMGGTAISQHAVVLGGLAPATTYRYKLTATDAQGLVFQTPGLATFTTPREAVTHEQDVAIGAKVIAVSSQYGYAYRATDAVDGNLATQWSSDGDGDHAFITIELKQAYKINGVAFITRAMSDGSAITRTFAVVVAGKRYGPFPAGTAVDPHIARVSFTGRVIRFEVVTSTGGNTGAAEVEAFSAS